MPTRTESQSFEDILEHLRQMRGFDFTAYKRASLMRRVVKRMHTVQVENFEAYLDYLQVHQEEFEALFNTILINVTSFFRDPDVWDYLDAEVAAVVAGRPPGVLPHPRMERGVRVGPGGLQRRDAAGATHRSRPARGAREDLRD